MIGLYRILYMERAQRLETDFIIKENIVKLSFLEYMNTVKIVRVGYIYIDNKNNQFK